MLKPPKGSLPDMFEHHNSHALDLQMQNNQIDNVFQSMLKQKQGIMELFPESVYQSNSPTAARVKTFLNEKIKDFQFDEVEDIDQFIPVKRAP